MMLPTHLVVCIGVAVLFAPFIPMNSSLAFLGIIIGGIFPDLDFFREHRRLLHFPIGYPLIFIALGALALFFTTPVTVGLAAVAAGAAIHMLLDLYGGSAGTRPWEISSERGVYDHVRGRWLSPRGFVRYDGSPEDLGICLVIGIPLMLFTSGSMQWFIGIAIIVGITYTLFRRQFADLTAHLLSEELVSDESLPPKRPEQF